MGFLQRSSRPSRLGGFGFFVMTAALCLLVDGWRVFCWGGCHWSGVESYIADDVYFYLGIAENIYSNGLVSFDGITETSGFHPLWLLVLVGLRALISNPDAFVVAAYLTHQFCCLLGGLYLYRVVVNAFGFSSWSVAACLSYLLAGSHISAGMEVCLVLLIFPEWFRAAIQYVDKPTIRRAAYLGFTSAALALARLDSVILLATATALIYLQQLDIRKPALMILRPVGFFAGLTPLFFFVLWSKFRFDTFVPLSGVAKSLKTEAGLAAAPFTSMYSGLGLTSLLCLLSIAVASLSILRMIMHRKILGPHRPLIFSILVFPHFLLLATSLRSDWSLWPWYAYPFVLSGAVAMIVLGVAKPGDAQRDHPTAALRPLALVSLVFMALVAFKALYRSGPGFNNVGDVAHPLAVWAETRPGIYAMGDGAGSVGYFLKRPLIQLEGLVSDHVIIDHIRAEDDLVQVLKEMDVRYYITFRAEADGSCWLVQEPHVPGHSSPRMTGRFCDQPAMSSRFLRLSDEVSLMIFDVSRETSGLARELP